MPSTEETVKTYSAAWTETDAGRRLEMLERCWTEGGVYSDPLNVAEGREALDALIGATQQQFPGVRFAFESGIDQHHEFIRFQWRMVRPNGDTLVDGLDVGELAPDGRLRRITGFFGPFPKVPN